MSTRCQIEFKHITKYLKQKPITERRTIYRHSDGYPDGVVPDLKEFLKWNLGRNSDIEYQVANFIYWSKRHNEENYFNKKSYRGKIENPKLKWSDNQSTNCSVLHTGFGICENDGFHGDIEYFYEVIFETTQKKEATYVIRSFFKVYKVEQENWRDPITRKDLKLIKEIKIERKELKSDLMEV